YGPLLEPHPLRGGGAVRARDRRRPWAGGGRGHSGRARHATRRAPATRPAGGWSHARGVRRAGSAARGGERRARSRRARGRSCGRRDGAGRRRGDAPPRLADRRAPPGGPRARGDIPPPGRRRRPAPMMVVLAVARKELALYFTSFLFYALAAVFLVLSGYYFYTNLGFFVLMGGMDLPRGLWQYEFVDIQQRLLVLVPLLTMRLFAEERKLGTLELLWTYPVRDAEIIAGKFVACLAIVSLLIAATAIYPLMLALFTPVAPG